MALPASYDFAGTGALSASWTQGLNTITRDTDIGTGSASADYNIAYWTADSFNNDQKATVIVGNKAGPAVRCTGTAGTFSGYIAIWYSADSAVEIQRISGGSFAALIGTYTSVTFNGTSDTLTLEVSGTSLLAKKNGVALGSAFTDANIASGSAGVAMDGNSGFIDDFVGDNLAGGGGGSAVASPFFFRRSRANAA